jgi:hypothetical protein
VRVSNRKLVPVPLTAHPAITGEVARVHDETLELSLDARNRVGEGRFACQQELQICRGNRGRRLKMQADRSRHTIHFNRRVSLGYDLVDDDVDQSVTSHRVCGLTERITARAHGVA